MKKILDFLVMYAIVIIVTLLIFLPLIYIFTTST